MKFPLKF